MDDGLVGKTKALNVAKVIAVASSGFASSAIKKQKRMALRHLHLKKRENRIGLASQ